MKLLEAAAALTREDRKTYRPHAFAVPPATRALRIGFRYDRGGEDPHSLMTLQLFDPAGFRGAGHRFAPRQTIWIGEDRATAGFVPGPIRPGGWKIEVDVHSVIARADGAPNAYTIEIEAVEAVDDGMTLPRLAAFPDSPRIESRRWLRGELHLHSEHSDGRWTTGEMAALARHRRLDFMFLTDHNTTTGVDILRSQVGDAISVLPGIELTTYAGHALALGADRWVDWRTGHEGYNVNTMARNVHQAGSFLVIAHPDAPPDDVCTGCRWTHHDFDPGLADAVEVWGGLWNGPEERNQGCIDLWREWLNAGRRMTATGATDAHRPEDWEGDVPITCVEADDASLKSVLEALRAGRTYVSSGPALSIRALGRNGSIAGVGGKVDHAAAEAIEIACVESPDAELRLVANGAVIEKTRVDASGSLRARPRAGDLWCCAELWNPAGDTLLAVTSPVYFAPDSEAGHHLRVAKTRSARDEQ
jgi:hypothetical protein